MVLISSDIITRKSLKLLRYVNVFWKMYKFLKKSQWWDRDKLVEYQLEQLSRLLEHAYENVPFYRKIFDDHGLKPRDIQDLKDLKQLPIITKDDVRNNLSKMTARNFPRHAIEYMNTGGSTGDPLGFYVEKGATEAKEYAFIKSMWDRVAYHFWDKSVVLRGYTVPEDRLYRHAFLGRWLILSSFHLDDKTIPLYLKKIQTFNPKYIMAYPSSITILAQYIKSRGISLKLNLKALLLGSEEVYPFQRQLLEEIFKTRVFSWYGQSEKVVLAGECEESTCYHIFPEYGITEVVDEKGRDVGYGKAGMVVGTSFLNYAMPLIRYYTGDLAILSDEKCGCGREYPLMKQVIGRAQDFIVTKGGKLIPLTALIFGQHFKVFSKIRQMQIVQEEKGVIKVKIVKGLEYTKEDEEEIYQKIKSIMGGELDVFFEYCHKIPRTKLGKHRFLIQKLKIPLKTHFE